MERKVGKVDNIGKSGFIASILQERRQQILSSKYVFTSTDLRVQIMDISTICYTIFGGTSKRFMTRPQKTEKTFQTTFCFVRLL